MFISFHWSEPSNRTLIAAVATARSTEKRPAPSWLASVVPLELLHVFDARPLVLIAEFTPVGVAAILDEIRAHVQIKKLFHQLPMAQGVVLASQRGELLPRPALQDTIDVRLQHDLHILRV